MQGFFRMFGWAYRMVGVLILTAMVLIVFVNACMRYAFNSGFIATEEVLRYLFIYMTFIGVVEVAYQRGHISVTILTDALHGRLRTAVHIAGYILMLFAVWVLIDGTAMYYEESATSVGQVTKLPFRVVISAMMFGALGLAVFIIRDLVLGIRAFASGTEFPPRQQDGEIAEAIEDAEEIEKSDANGEGR